MSKAMRDRAKSDNSRRFVKSNAPKSKRPAVKPPVVVLR